MYKIDSSGNVAGLFTNGDPGVTLATVVDATWLNAVQTEIVNVVQASGEVLDKTNSAQLLGALKLLSAPTLLNPFVTYNKAAMTFDGAWHTLTVAGVPAGATWMYIGGYAQNKGADSGGVDNGRQKLQVRPNGAGQAMLISFTNGVSGSYEDDSAIGPCIVPCAGADIDYNWSAGITDANLIIYGYM